MEKCAQGEEKEKGGGKREPVGMATDFNLQILVMYVMFKLTVWVAGTDDRVINFESCALRIAILILRIRIKRFQ